MKSAFHMIAATAAALLSATQASAQDDRRGAYGELSVGAATVGDVDLAYLAPGGEFGGTGAQDSAEFRADLKSAIAFGGTLGYDFGLIRADLRVDYSRNRINSLTVGRINGNTVTISPADGADICDYLELDGCAVSGNTISGGDSKLRQLSALANLWVDIPTGGRVTPYVGGGAGIGGYEVGGEGKARFA